MATLLKSFTAKTLDDRLGSVMVKSFALLFESLEILVIEFKIVSEAATPEPSYCLPKPLYQKLSPGIKVMEGRVWY